MNEIINLIVAIGITIFAIIIAVGIFSNEIVDIIRALKSREQDNEQEEIQ